MSVRRPALLIAAFLLAAACRPPRPAALPRKLNLHYEHSRFELDNGVRVIVLPDPTTDLIVVDVHYAVGAGDDPAGRAGLAHLVEHMTYEVRARGMSRPPLDEWLRALSLQYNAATTADETRYWTLADKGGLEDILALESKRMILCNTISEETFQHEREVVRNEIRERSSGLAQARDRLRGLVYPEGHRYRRDIGGDDEQVAAATLAESSASTPRTT